MDPTNDLCHVHSYTGVNFRDCISFQNEGKTLVFSEVRFRFVICRRDMISKYQILQVQTEEFQRSSKSLNIKFLFWRLKMLNTSDI